jgi:predicted aspartyl protease
MVKIYSFERASEDSLIIVEGKLNRSYADLVLDTGATHTYINYSILINSGIRISDSVGEVLIETANGIISANKFIVKSLEVFGIKRENFEVSSFIFDDPEENYQGVVGLDFLSEVKFCLDLKKSEISIST